MWWLATFARTLTAIVLIVAGISKLADRERFARIVENYQMLPRQLVRAVATLLPLVEIVVAAMLVTRIGSTSGGFVATTLFLVFAGAMAVNLLRGRSNIACGCFGANVSSPLRWRYVARNVALALTALVGTPVWWWGARPWPLSNSDELAAMLAAAIAAICYWFVASSIGVLLRTPPDWKPMPGGDA
jgi:hypothetical protein